MLFKPFENRLSHGVIVNLAKKTGRQGFCSLKNLWLTFTGENFEEIFLVIYCVILIIVKPVFGKD
jgi:hypothetical protein